MLPDVKFHAERRGVRIYGSRVSAYIFAAPLSTFRADKNLFRTFKLVVLAGYRLNT